tara:strand:+ start:5979 stop:6632 length:654 start_codon:yes stop_codon:yes gene_type:complete
MQRPKRITLSPTALDANGISTTQTPAAGGVQSLTMTGVLATGGVATFATPQHVTISAAGVDTTRTFTVTGTDRWGAALTETITGVNTATVAGLKNFATVTGITVDADTASAITAGVDGTCESAWHILSQYDAFNVALGVVVSSGAVLTYTVQHTFDDLQAAGFVQDGANTFNHDSLVANTASNDGHYTNPPSATRMSITAHTSGTVIFNVISGGGGI